MWSYLIYSICVCSFLSFSFSMILLAALSLAHFSADSHCKFRFSSNPFQVFVLFLCFSFLSSLDQAIYKSLSAGFSLIFGHIICERFCNNYHHLPRLSPYRSLLSYNPCLNSSPLLFSLQKDPTKWQQICVPLLYYSRPVSSLLVSNLFMINNYKYLKLRKSIKLYSNDTYLVQLFIYSIVSIIIHQSKY